MEAVLEALWGLIPVPVAERGDRLFSISIRIMDPWHAHRQNRAVWRVTVEELCDPRGPDDWAVEGCGETLGWALKTLARVFPVVPEIGDLPMSREVDRPIDLLERRKEGSGAPLLTDDDLRGMVEAIAKLDAAAGPGRRLRDGAVIVLDARKAVTQRGLWTIRYAVRDADRHEVHSISLASPGDYLHRIVGEAAYALRRESAKRAEAYAADLRQLRSLIKIGGGVCVTNVITPVGNVPRLVVGPQDGKWHSGGGWVARIERVRNYPGVRRWNGFATPGAVHLVGFGADPAGALADLFAPLAVRVCEMEGIGRFVGEVFALARRVPVAPGVQTTYLPWPQGVDGATFSHLHLAIDLESTLHESWGFALVSKHDGHPVTTVERGREATEAAGRLLLQLERRANGFATAEV